MNIEELREDILHGDAIDKKIQEMTEVRRFGRVEKSFDLDCRIEASWFRDRKCRLEGKK
jgi:hypothetical protein